MLITAKSNLTVQEIISNLYSMPEWDPNSSCIIDEDFDSEAEVHIKFSTDNQPVYIRIKTAYSGFEYHIQDYLGSAEIQYTGAYRGFLAQQLLPEMGAVEIKEVSGSFALANEPERWISTKVFEHIRYILHKDVATLISPLKLGDVKWSQEAKQRLGLTYKSYGGWVSNGLTVGRVLGVWATPERHEEIQKAFSHMDKRPWGNDKPLEFTRQDLLKIEA